jgi:hypothetical protein
MARISLPQMVEAFILTKTCPHPGWGTGHSFKITLLLPGRYAARMVPFIKNLLLSNIV